MVSIYVILMKGNYMQSSTYVYSILLLVLGRSLLVTMSRRHHEGDLNAFLDTGDARIGLIKSENI